MKTRRVLPNPLIRTSVTAKKEWRPQRDLNPAEINKNLGFFEPKVAQGGPFWCKLDTGVQLYLMRLLRLFRLLARLKVKRN
jgi:hypothetical protein